MPIGNLTSQIFANIYLHDLDHFVKHTLQVKSYLRYGDDFIIGDDDRQKLIDIRKRIIVFLQDQLKLRLNPKNNYLIKAKHGLKFLGVIIYPTGRKLNKRSKKRVIERLTPTNVGSYYGLSIQHQNAKFLKEFHWTVLHSVVL